MSATISIGYTTPKKCYERSNSPKLLEYAEQNRQQGFFNDVTIETESQSFSANRMVLSCCSRYFERMFTTNMSERNQPSVEVKSVDADSAGDLIEYIYTGKITINCEKVGRILSAADYLQIDDVKELCFDYLQRALSPENCFTLLAIADRYVNQAFKKLCEHFLADNFKKVLLSEGFKQCSKQYLINLLYKLRESQVEETLLYRSIVAWTKYDEENRAPGFHDLLKLINFDEIPSQFMEDEICDEELLTINPGCWKLFNQAVKMCLRSIRTRESGDKIVSIGGVRTPLKVNEVHNVYHKPFSTFPDLPEGRMAGCAVKMQDSIYFIGGKIPDEYPALKTVWSMKLKDKTLKWKEESSLNVERMAMGAAVFNNWLVVVGGAEGTRSRALPSCEAYLPSSRSWINLPSMNESRAGHAVVFCQDYFALGGYNDTNGYLSSVERMLAFQKWVTVKPMQSPRRWFSAVNCNDVVYAIGGQAENLADTTQKSVEKYDPAADEWTYVSDMNFARNRSSACVLQGKIFVVGGTNERDEAVKEIECYDPEADIWNIVGKSNDELYRHSLVVF